MNLVFGSEVALFGFWKYMFGILLTVYQPRKLNSGEHHGSRYIEGSWDRYCGILQYIVITFRFVHNVLNGF
jgi:hypothetical protein